MDEIYKILNKHLNLIFSLDSSHRDSSQPSFDNLNPLKIFTALLSVKIDVNNVSFFNLMSGWALVNCSRNFFVFDHSIDKQLFDSVAQPLRVQGAHTNKIEKRSQELYNNSTLNIILNFGEHLMNSQEANGVPGAVDRNHCVKMTLEYIFYHILS